LANYNGLTLTFAELSQMLRRAFRLGGHILLACVLAGLWFLKDREIEWLLAYLMFSLPAIMIIHIWSGQGFRGVPLLPVLALQQMVVFTAPILAETPATALVSDSLMARSGVVMLVFYICLYFGWAMSFNPRRHERGSRWNLGIAEGLYSSERMLALSILLLLVTAAFQFSLRTGFLYSIIPDSLVFATPILRSVANAAGVLGGLIGAMMIGRGATLLQALLYWGLVLISAVLLIADVLLSSVSGLVIAVVLGLFFSLGRVPWKFLILAFLVLAFFNQGKFAMRAKYWGENGQPRSQSILQLPSFFAEWAAVSSWYLFSAEQRSIWGSKSDRGQAITDRVNNLQNLTFVLNSIERGNHRLLQGETYTLIPKLLVPRFFWPNKPRAHEGQVLLNLHFGRQETLKATQETYIAWGLVAEAVGNFGWLLGPVVLGLVMGWGIARIESWSLGLRLFSVDGILVKVILMSVSLSYEMVASVLVTSVFQALVSSAAGGFFLYHWFGAGRQRNAANPSSIIPARGSKINRYAQK
jgi:hypothetical protein